MLGLCARARRLISGEKACIEAVRGGRAQLCVLDGGAGPNAVKAVCQACASHDVPLIRTQPGMLGAAIGRPSRLAAVVTDPKMAQAILRIVSAGTSADWQ